MNKNEPRVKFELKLPVEFEKSINKLISTINKNGYEAYLVGGSVRDLIIGRPVYDFDLATNAHPNKLMSIFRKVIPTGIKHGTVTVLIDEHKFEVTTYRADGKYIDGRRPSEVTFSSTLEEDVKRRDFTINGLAYDINTGELIDYVGGLFDLQQGVIKTIGNPLDRFQEDGLRTFRACRFGAKLNFKIEDKTFKAISDSLNVSAMVSAERIRDELMKILEADKPSVGIDYMRDSGLLKLVLPELQDCIDVEQNKYHVYDVYHHSVYACDAAPADKPLLRLSALLHDLGKVPVRGKGADNDYTFYNHEVVGAKMARKIMRRLKFSNEDVEIVGNLVVNHMFHYTSDWTDGAVRRFMRKVGVENLTDLFILRLADRRGNGNRDGLPAPIKELKVRINRVIEEANAITVRDLKIDGYIIMKEFQVEPGPIIGQILNGLLELVLDNPELNEPETLLAQAHLLYEEIKSNSTETQRSQIF